MNKILHMALLASTLVSASSAIAKPGDGPRKVDPPQKAEPIHCQIGKVAMDVFDGCPNEATLCSKLIGRSLLANEQRDFNQSPHLDLGKHRQAIQNCLVKFEREVLGD